MIRKCYNCGNTLIVIEHGKINYHYYPNINNYCTVCDRSNTQKIAVEELKIMINIYKNATYEHGYDIKKLEHILEVEEMLETLDKMRNEK